MRMEWPYLLIMDVLKNPLLIPLKLFKIMTIEY
jgi:hypothetical protein